MNKLSELQKKAYELRMDCIRLIHESPVPAGHVGGCLSSAEILAALYYDVLKVNPSNPREESRDRFILSKGHNCTILYAALADKGFFPKDLLKTYRAENSILQGHPDANKCPGIEVTTGSLGQGLSMGVGMALAGRLKKNPYNVCVLISDGELQSGMTWEAVMAAGYYKLDKLICIVDRNHLQVNGAVEKVMDVEPLEEKWRSFGWTAMRIDGHDMQSILSAMYLAKTNTKRPTVIICDTLKGKGVSFMENVTEWHASEVTDEVYNKAITELNEHYQAI